MNNLTDKYNCIEITKDEFIKIKKELYDIMSSSSFDIVKKEDKINELMDKISKYNQQLK